MKLTKREKGMLFGTLFIIVIAVFISYVYIPLTKDIKKLENTSEEQSLQIMELETKQTLMKELEKQYIQLQNEVNKKQSDILSVWDQAELLVYVEKTIDGLCEKETIDFYDPVEIASIKSGDIGLKIKTNYLNLKNIWKKFEDSKYYNTLISYEIKQVDNTNSEMDDINAIINNKYNLEVIMNLRFYSQNILNEYPEEYDFMRKNFGKNNLFK